MAPVESSVSPWAGGPFSQRVRLRGEGRSPSYRYLISCDPVPVTNVGFCVDSYPFARPAWLVDLTIRQSASEPARESRGEARRQRSRIKVGASNQGFFCIVGYISCSRHDASIFRSAVRSLFGLPLLWTASGLVRRGVSGINGFDVLT